MTNDETESSKPGGHGLKRIAGIAFMLLAGAVVGAGLTKLAIVDRFKDSNIESPWLVLLALPLLCFIVLLTHEFGHVVGGWMTGHELYMLVVGPIRLVREGRRFHLKWNRNAAMAGGLAVCLPTRLDRLAVRRFVYVLMGPMASALLAGGCWALSLATTSAPLLSVCLLITAAISAVITLITVFPQHAGGLASDGAQMLTLIRGGPEAEKINHLIVLQNMSLSGTRPRDWDKDFIQSALELPSTQISVNASLNLFAYAHRLDSGDVDEAEPYLETALVDFDDLPVGFRQAFAAEAAFFAAYYREDRDRAEAWHAQSIGGFVEASQRAQLDAAMMLLQGDHDGCRQRIDDARESIKSSVDRGGMLAKLDELDQMESRLAQSVTGTQQADAEAAD